ncbi:cupin domain-containing protein [Euryhalocaulis caribicus]|uniref:cupin domain-containing protein n=1 Tax=Euryhalocaulis caribicus TaxID=1161401 RepID=UPI0005266415|nr:cupin domain-containing protein [Euryhalocaulis caribicus]
MQSPNFESFEWSHGKVRECDPNFPTTLHAWDKDALTLKGMSAFFGFVAEGEAVLTTESGAFRLKTGMYFSANGKVTVQGGRGIVIERHDHRAYFLLGGPVEEKGRLKYIDGCTDSLLLPPVRYGDPCLNLLYFPPGIDQTSHTHPSDRIGCVFSGRGECETPEGIIPLTPGTMFRIPAEGAHKFRTTDSAMRVIAYHPDSDFGPTDQTHPMINRTMVEGVSASQLPQLQTA